MTSRKVNRGTTVKAVKAVKAVGRASAGVHVVQPRDTIGAIAKRYGVSVRQLARWNDLERDVRIFPGDRLRVAAAGRPADSDQGGFR
jgi:LysM repeat protein